MPELVSDHGQSAPATGNTTGCLPCRLGDVPGGGDDEVYRRGGAIRSTVVAGGEALAEVVVFLGSVREARRALVERLADGGVLAPARTVDARHRPGTGCGADRLARRADRKIVARTSTVSAEIAPVRAPPKRSASSL